MNKKVALILSVLVLGFSLLTYSTQAQGHQSPAAWQGSWQLGPDIDSTLTGCTTPGFARFTAIYSPQQDRIYFMGGRCEDGSTSGNIFFFDISTGVWGTTYKQWETPVSNYQVVELQNSAAEIGFYIIGGRTAGGTYTNVVQVYYPGTNTVDTLEVDPFPGGSYIPGGVVVVNNLTYVFGGFDGVTMYDASYVFDILGPDGSRWSNTDCDLPTGRSYISAVAVGNMVYAIGGDEYVAPNLVPLYDTLVWDISNPVSCWNDSLMADLPAPNGDAPAVYTGENLLRGSILVIGGTWPLPNPWVFRYQLASDSWEMFPQLNIPRRNQAAVYIPSTSPGAGQGVPGIPGVWTFGGFIGNAAMTASSEFLENPAIHLYLPFTSR